MGGLLATGSLAVLGREVHRPAYIHSTGMQQGRCGKVPLLKANSVFSSRTLRLRHSSEGNHLAFCG